MQTACDKNEEEAFAARERLFKRFRTKRTVWNICMGIDVYLFALYVSQIAFVSGLMLLGKLFPDVYQFAGVLDGLAGIASGIFGCILLFYFAQSRKEKGVLFQEESLRKSILGRNRRIPFFTLIGFAAMLYVLQIFSGIVLTLLEYLLNGTGLTIMNSPALNADYTLSGWLLLYAVVIGPICEELAFRGFILKGLKENGKVFAILFSAIAFCLMHGDIQQILFTFIAGVLFGYIAMEYSIFASVLLHAYNNGLIAELLMYLGKVLPESVFTIVSAFIFLLCLLITIVFVRKRYKHVICYIREDVTEEGAWKALLNPWFIVFAAICVYLTIQTITPM